MDVLACYLVCLYKHIALSIVASSFPQLRVICHSPDAGNDNHGTNAFCAAEIALMSQGNLFPEKRNFKIRRCVFLRVICHRASTTLVEGNIE